MNLELDAQYRSDFYFQPVYLPDGGVLGVELIVNFVGVDAPVRIPTELVAQVIKSEQQLILFSEQLELLNNYQEFFKTQRIVVWVNISAVIADAILNDTDLASRLAQLPFIEFTINENFPELNRGIENACLMAMTRHYPLALANFGAGIATSKPIFDGIFKRVFLDKTFIHKQIKQRSFEPFMLAMLAQLSPFCQTLAITGIDDEAARQKVLSFAAFAMQGNLWPGIAPEKLEEWFHPDSPLLN
ncbi:EAL domain-containing protein [Buttiauxella selenatireducens]|uniref:EAL domain-containing protein n=1 Tax=Buttiauxella selenatireducens TaxID=3073902 RepID=A0ABY9S558_9ENTR|nr:EAL domain-containing protein [Buttiauxella sp. R73]WMY72648.1 EAL domain-containing protein [Buttiauxella sp. R73]